MSEILLQTKLFVPPLRPLLVPRPRLFASLDAGLYGKLSLVSAPAGFGKTTLVAHWLSQQERPVAWLSLDENDDQPLRFFTYLVAAMRTIEPGLAEGLAASLRSSNPPDETAVVPALLNELADYPLPFVLVLDDYHAITDETIHQALALLIDHLPPSMHLIITGREDPPLPLPRWRARGQLTDTTQADLRFTPGEAADFLAGTMGLSLPDTAVANLETRTEGWVAGLQLAALSLRSVDNAGDFIEAFVGSDRQVADYLLQEVLLQQPQPIQHFLLQTSLLERFNAPLCDALLDRRDSQDILDTLDQNNLFIIPLDNSRYWYRYHHLFAELLRYRLARDWPETAIADLHRRAARWYEAQDLLQEAIEHYIQIPDYDEVARLLTTLPLNYIFEDGGSLRVQEWVTRLPQSILPSHPYIAALMAAASLVNGQAGATMHYLAMFETDEALRPYTHLFNSILIRNDSGDFRQALRLARQALAAAGQDELLVHMAWGQIAVNYLNMGLLEEADEAIMEMRGAIQATGLTGLTMQLQALELQGINALAQGNVRGAEKLYREGIELAAQNEHIHSPLIGIMYSGLANVYYQWNDLDRARSYVDMALDWARRTGISDLFTYSAFIVANLACCRGDKAALQDALDLFSAHFDTTTMDRFSATLDRVAAWYWLRIGDLNAAIHWADASGLSLDDDPAYHDFDTYYALVAIRLAQSRRSGDSTRLPSLLAMARKLERRVISSRHVAGLVEALALLALILDQQGDPAAVPTIQKALDLARPGNMLRILLDWGEPMHRLLLKALPAEAARPDTTTYNGRLLEAFAAQEKTIPMPLPAVHLTGREREILELIAAGLSNKQIEETLFISKNTVRTHIKNLYSKLSVSSRTQAIKQAHELNLLP